MSWDMGARYTRAPIQINVDFRNPDWVYTVNRRFRSTCVLRVAFEDSTLTQCHFCWVLMRDAICMRSLHVHTCTCLLIVVVRFYSILRQQFFCELGLIWISGIRIDLDLHPCVVSPMVSYHGYLYLTKFKVTSKIYLKHLPWM